ncbi:hypothetical protein BD769DRAFT_1463703 [Suillus cothurnatus]|nr:hypothetical protein BD769DRAFT_1463703 [Suillus cothurnatus]
MALYTPPSLPLTPCKMGSSSRPSLPTELLATWSAWLPLAQTGLLTSSNVTVLATHCHFDRPVSYMHQDTYASTWSRPVSNHTVAPMSPDRLLAASEIVPRPIDWFDDSLSDRPIISQKKKTANDMLPMVLYVTFKSTSTHHSILPYSPEIPAATSSLQLAASSTFVSFMQKKRNRYTAGLPGTALMMANKFLTNMSEVSGIELLLKITRMEKEGLVHAKERECRRWRHTRARHRTPRHTQPMSAAPIRSYRWRCHSTSHRARSTSPEQPIHPHAYPSPYHVTPPNPVVSPCLAPGLKRSAADAFSPTSSSFHELPPLKRPTGMTLQIPDTNHPTAPHSASPVESLQSFAKMSLSSSSSPHSVRSAQSNSHQGDTLPQTLVAAYRAEGPVNVPQNLYYYSLAGSSTDYAAEEERVRRKARLRCYQPQPPPPPSYPPPYMPQDIQSESVSPYEIHVDVRAVPLPHIHDAVWSRKLARPPSYGEIPSAPFANAGPPGVHFYSASSQRESPAYPYNWSYGR